MTQRQIAIFFEIEKKYLDPKKPYILAELYIKTSNLKETLDIRRNPKICFSQNSKKNSCEFHPEKRILFS